MTDCKQSSDMTLAEWLDYLENRHAQEVHLRLVNAKAVAEQLDLLNLEPQVITITGTNGKGSTVAALETIYCVAGYRVGAYTSPHLLQFNERIRINQEQIKDSELCDAFTQIENTPGGSSLTYFEMATLAALLHFKKSALDVIILEVGVGGRLDATNIIDADLAIITTVDLDHQDYLGDTQEAIGLEKAGILRAGKPFIYGDNNPPETVIEQARLLNCMSYYFGQDFSCRQLEENLSISLGPIKTTLTSPLAAGDRHLNAHRSLNQTFDLPRPTIHYKAALSAIIATQVLQDVLPVLPNDWTNAMHSVNILARQQVIEGTITTILDVAHNPQSVELLVQFLKTYSTRGQIHAVFSALKDKNLPGLINPLRSLVKHWYPALLNSKRAASEPLLKSVFEAEIGYAPICFNNPVISYQAAINAAKPGDVIVVYGSFLTVGAVMAFHNEGL